ncbi:MAG TPA: 4-hydroxythreonine-4-phosphate dehydrogenase PdxA [Phycisphaerales bacterium]|nr:4-hydroxythreonine-4-phosphate dehydrogenase PdxA [Phycisphaerales bacterium]
MPAEDMRPITIAVSTGDPLGIGPEISRAALAQAPAGVRIETFGTLDTWPCDAPRAARADAGRASWDALSAAIDAVKRGECDALVTAPISKEAWHAAGVTRHPGHTEVLAEAFASGRSGMLFVGPRLKVMLATIHVPLGQVPALLTRDTVGRAIELAHEACLAMGSGRPRIAVAGLNPHAGEHGLLGPEDDAVIRPAVEHAAAARIDATGPWPGDTVFGRALKGEFDAVVAMYHDQGLIPVKLIDGAKSVNVTVGLEWNGRRVVRTSPAHGTAFDIAGQGKADATSMVEAVELAVRMLRGGGEARA